MKTSDAQLRAAAKYAKKKIRKMTFSFNRETDADILEKLESIDNKQGYIKGLIRKDIQENS
ncbi:hypothetical protein [Pseudoramibacter alactolyticus]|uniref:hypothetical protein n=1 Tax=Pseudoramibacter alactolyticus TaxID=113287 RepID=UPI0023543F63|nr:hypothetical protein [Pseudoramibacter alactolyticus]MBM6968689.1 hypothetical protein [Pseudoramibacter alactolyticus]